MAASELHPLRALLLTAGLGTRLRPLSDVRAKAAVPVNGQPLVHRVMRWLAAAGVRDLVLNLHHKPSSITGAVGDGLELGVRVRYSWEQPVLGSAGGPRHALPLLTDGTSEPFLIVNGDTLTDVDVGTLVEHHRRSGALVTMALIEIRPAEMAASRYPTTASDQVRSSRSGNGTRSLHWCSGGPQRPQTSTTSAESVSMLYQRQSRPTREPSPPRLDGVVSRHQCRATRDRARPRRHRGAHLIGSSARIGSSAVSANRAVG